MTGILLKLIILVQRLMSLFPNVLFLNFSYESPRRRLPNRVDLHLFPGRLRIGRAPVVIIYYYLFIVYIL
jgi:hypothetical protein